MTGNNDAINLLTFESVKQFNKAKCEKLNVKRSSFFNNTLLGLEEAYELSKKVQNLSQLEQFKLEFNLAAVYTFIKNSNKAKYYLNRLRKNLTNDQNKRYQISLLYLKLANDLRLTTNNNNSNTSKLLESIQCYKYSLQYLNESPVSSSSSSVNELKCKILISILNLSTKESHSPHSNDHLVIDDECECLIETTLDICDGLNGNACFKAKVYSDISLLYAKTVKRVKHFDKAKLLLEKSIKILNSHDNCSNSNVIVDNLSINLINSILNHNLGALHNRYAKYTKSIEYINNSVDLLKKEMKCNNNDKNVMLLLSDVCYNLGYAYAKLKRYNEAKHAFTESIEHINDFNNKSKIECLIAMANLNLSNNEEYGALDNYRQALEIHLKEYPAKACNHNDNGDEDEDYYDQQNFDIEKKLRKKIDLIEQAVRLRENFQSAINTQIIKEFCVDRYKMPPPPSVEFKKANKKHGRTKSSRLREQATFDSLDSVAIVGDNSTMVTTQDTTGYSNMNNSSLMTTGITTHDDEDMHKRVAFSLLNTQVAIDGKSELNETKIERIEHTATLSSISNTDQVKSFEVNLNNSEEQNPQIHSQNEIINKYIENLNEFEEQDQ